MTWSAIGSAPLALERTASAYGQILKAQATHPLADARDDGFRDPFLRPDEAAAARVSGQSAPSGLKFEDLRLTGVVVTGSHRFAYINGKRLREGERLDSFLVDQIDFNRVTVSGGMGKNDLWLTAALPREDPAKRQLPPEQVFPGLAGILAATAASAAAQAASTQGVAGGNQAATQSATQQLPTPPPTAVKTVPGELPSGLSFFTGS